MKSINIISPEQGSTKGGGGPEDDPRYPRVALRWQGLLTLAFGFALGVALVVVYLLLQLPIIPQQLSDLFPRVQNTLILNLIFYFGIGFVSGTFIAAFYNMLVVRRFNLFGMEIGTD